MSALFLENEAVEIQLVLEAIHLKYGYDFRDYSRAHVKRRLFHRLHVSGCRTFLDMLRKILYEPHFFEEMLTDFSVSVTEMFRDPSFYLAIRETVIPELTSFPFIKIWHAGCASGEEVYSMAITLKEEDVFPKVRIYATDFNETVLQKAREGIYPIHLMRQYTANYHKAGGRQAFSDYYAADYDRALMDDDLKRPIIFAGHNLVTDSVFQEMHLIVCRNVLIYFNRNLQDRVVRLFTESLAPGGFLCLGSKESIQFSGYCQQFETVRDSEKIFRKKA